MSNNLLSSSSRVESALNALAANYSFVLAVLEPHMIRPSILILKHDIILDHLLLFLRGAIFASLLILHERSEIQTTWHTSRLPAFDLISVLWHVRKIWHVRYPAQSVDRRRRLSGDLGILDDLDKVVVYAIGDHAIASHILLVDRGRLSPML